MGKVETTTTDFKRALKTVTDTMTASEQKTYDVGIHIHYKGDTGTITMRHPVNQMVVIANFEGEPNENELDMLFFIEDLSNSLKKFRKKESLYIDEGMGTIMISVESGMVYESTLLQDEIPVPELKDVYVMNRKEFIDILNISQAVTKTTFDDSTMSLQFVGARNKLHIKATNFAQMSISELVLDRAVTKPFEVTLSAKELTKVRNVIDRGKSDLVSFSYSDNYLLLKTDITGVGFVNEDKVNHINANMVLKSLKWEKEIYKIDAVSNLEVIKEQYSELRTAEDYRDEENNRDDELIAKYQSIYLTNDPKDGCLKFSQEPRGVKVDTRDMNSLFSKIPNEMEVAFSKKAMLMNYATDTMKTMILVPIADVK